MCQLLLADNKNGYGGLKFECPDYWIHMDAKVEKEQRLIQILVIKICIHVCFRNWD